MFGGCMNIWRVEIVSAGGFVDSVSILAESVEKADYDLLLVDNKPVHFKYSDITIGEVEKE